MKVARFVLKIVALSLAAASLTCAIIAYSDKIGALFGKCFGKFRREVYASEYDDYEESDENSRLRAAVFMRTSADTGDPRSGAAGRRTAEDLSSVPPWPSRRPEAECLSAADQTPDAPVLSE